jgi:hypothetical protein
VNATRNAVLPSASVAATQRVEPRGHRDLATEPDKRRVQLKELADRAGRGRGEWNTLNRAESTWIGRRKGQACQRRPGPDPTLATARLRGRLRSNPPRAISKLRWEVFFKRYINIVRFKINESNLIYARDGYYVQDTIKSLTNQMSSYFVCTCLFSFPFFSVEESTCLFSFPFSLCRKIRLHRWCS